MAKRSEPKQYGVLAVWSGAMTLCERAWAERIAATGSRDHIAYELIRVRPPTPKAKQRTGCKESSLTAWGQHLASKAKRRAKR